MCYVCTVYVDCLCCTASTIATLLRAVDTGVHVLHKSASTRTMTDSSDESLADSVLLGGARGRAVEFYKAWDPWGALSNFSPHPIVAGEGPVSAQAVPQEATRSYPSVEHFYQSQKFAGVAAAAALREAIIAAPSPEEVCAFILTGCLNLVLQVL